MALLTARPSSSSKFSIEDPCFMDVDEHPNWQAQFQNNQPLKLEIGFGMGDFLVEMATREPDSNFIGIDFSQDGIRKVLALINELKLKNIRIVYGDVREKIPLLFQDGELNAVYINLPDPWPQKRHFKRRLVKPELAKMIVHKLVPEGQVYMATDSQSYALEILEYFDAEDLLHNINKETGLSGHRDHLPKTKYEKGFIYAGDPIYYLEYFRLAERGGIATPKSETQGVEQTGEFTNDEILIKKFQEAEAKARDACDLKQAADNLAEAGDNQWAGKVYKKAEDIAKDSLDFNWLAYSVSEVLGDKQWAADLYKKAEEKAESSLDLNWLGYSISETLGERDWARRLFQKAESQPGNIRELCNLADTLSEVLGDKEWEQKVYKKAEENAKEHADFIELADNILGKLEDRERAGGLYKKAEEKVEDCADMLSVVERVCQKMGDREWAGKIYIKAESLAQDSIDFCGLGDSLCQNLGDIDGAKSLYESAQAKAEESFEFRWLADSIIEKLGDKDWARALYKKAEDKAEKIYEINKLAKSLSNNLADEQWAEQVYRKAEKLV